MEVSVAGGPGHHRQGRPGVLGAGVGAPRQALEPSDEDGRAALQKLLTGA